jgi:hypothetical protein
MPISADQSAVLEMLLTKGQSFRDLDDLFGLDEGESHERARAALEELGGADPDRNVGLTEYLLGQADPIGRADSVRHLRQDGADRELADKIVTELTALFPGAELPNLPQAPTGSRFGGRQSAPPTKQPAGEPLPVKKSGSGLGSKQSRTIAALGGAGILLIVVVLAVAGVFSGDDEPSSASTSDTSETTASQDPLDPSTPIADGEEVSEIVMTPPGGGKASGVATIGISGGVQGYLDLVLTGMPEASKKQAFLAWFMFDEDQGYPLAAPIEPENGKFEGRFPIPQDVSQPIAQFTRAMEISLSNPEDILAAAENARDEGKFQITRPGATVMRGDIPKQPTGGGEDQQAPGEGGGGG